MRFGLQNLCRKPISADKAADDMLAVRDLKAGYGPSQVLFGIDFDVVKGEVVALLGRNGMGKSTTIKTVMGLLSLRGGDVLIRGQSIQGIPAYRIARMGLGLVPEGRRVFPTLTVEENLVATARPGLKSPRWTLLQIYQLFPRLEERRRHLGGKLSGGEQQMLAVGRALMTNPELLILDEATEGLAPLIRDQIWAAIASLKSEGQAILVVDKNLDALLKLADRHVIVEKGKTVWVGTSEALTADAGARLRYLGV